MGRMGHKFKATSNQIFHKWKTEIELPFKNEDNTTLSVPKMGSVH